MRTSALLAALALALSASALPLSTPHHHVPTAAELQESTTGFVNDVGQRANELATSAGRKASHMRESVAHLNPLHRNPSGSTPRTGGGALEDATGPVPPEGRGSRRLSKSSSLGPGEEFGGQKLSGGRRPSVGESGEGEDVPTEE